MSATHKRVYVYYDSDLDLTKTFSKLQDAKDYGKAQEIPELDPNIDPTGWRSDGDDVWYAGKDGLVSITLTYLDEGATAEEADDSESDEKVDPFSVPSDEPAAKEEVAV